MTTRTWLGRGARGLALGLLLVTGPVATMADPVDLTRAAQDLQLTPLRGAPAPPLALDGLDGKRVTLSDFGGRPVILYFWASW